MPAFAQARLFTGQTLTVVAEEIVGRELLKRGFIEVDLTRLLLQELQPGELFVDVGAQYGYYPLVAIALLGARASVVAFEPARSTFDLLVKNLGAYPQVTLENRALYSRNGSLTLHDFGLEYSALASLMGEAHVPRAERRRLPPARRYPVECVTLDSYLAGRQPAIIKIDAESTELEVLKGARQTLSRGVKLVTIETGDYGISGSARTRDAIDYLAQLAYLPLEHRAGRLRPHRRRSRYGYGNLYFKRPKHSA
jgi:FkbM family methyltransferase